MDSVLNISSIYAKLENIRNSLEAAFKHESISIPQQVARDTVVLRMSDLPEKPGLSKVEGQARLLHDLASIELQAMELGLRSLIEFPEAPLEFRQELFAVTLSESTHLRLCLEGIEDLGFRWGHWPVHTALWDAVRSEDSLLDRILIVHRYLEGSGLDAGEGILRKLNGVAQSCTHQIVGQIVHDEVAHVDFGSRWYRQICNLEKIDPETDFMLRMHKIKTQLPKRVEKISREIRLKAGFSQSEISILEKFRSEMLNA